MVDERRIEAMANKLPSAALCAHVHDSFTSPDVHDRDIDAFVSRIYESSRTIDVCKDLAYLAKARVSDTRPDLDSIHHLPLMKDRGQVVTDKDGFPYLSGKAWRIFNDALHAEQSPERDRSLILCTKLHAYVMPLGINEGAKRARDMINNIMSEHALSPEVLNHFRQYVRRRLSKMDYLDDYDWRGHLRPLKDLAAKYYGSSKKKGGYSYDKETNQATWSDKNLANNYDNFLLPLILGNSSIRQIYLNNKIDFLTLTMGIRPAEIVNDDNILMLSPCDLPIGRMGMRLQEAEKVRTLWMPHVVFESTIAPLTDLLESQVRRSRHQSTYLDDSDAAKEIRKEFFNNEKPSEMTIYSIDQSAFTDNFPYKLQRIVLEEYCHICGIPDVVLESFDLQVLGDYAPASFFKMEGNVHFAKGTPMGGEATFMLATHTHELLIDMCYDECRVSPRNRHYYVQGDDAVLMGDNVYQLYTHYMEELGCIINASKTLASNKAIEFCGWITTPEQSVPMFRPHNRQTDSVKDVLSDRAIQAFGLPALVTWITQERPDILDQCKVMGLIPIDDNEQVLLSAREVFKALSSSAPLLAPGITREHVQRMYELQSTYPECRYDEQSLDGIVNHGTRSDYGRYHRQISKLRRLKYQLTTDPMCDIIVISRNICDICDDINRYHADHISDLHPPIKGREVSEDRNPNKPFRFTIAADVTATKSLEIANKSANQQEGGMVL
jgi:hypothetical protein